MHCRVYISEAICVWSCAGRKPMASNVELFNVQQATGIAEFLTKFGFMGLGLFLFLLGIGFLIAKRDRLVSFVVGGIGLAFLVLFGAFNFFVQNHDIIVAQRLP